MSSNTFQNKPSYGIYSAIRNTNLLPHISANYDSKETFSPQKPKVQSQKNSSSLILYDYQSTLKKQIEETKLKEQLKKQRKRYKTLEAMYIEDRRSRLESDLYSEIQSIRYNLRSLSMLKESEIQKKQKMILLKSQLENNSPPPAQIAQMPFPQQIMPFYNPVPMQNPYNPYYQYNSQHPPNPYSYTQPYQQSPISQSHKNIGQSPKYNHSPHRKQNQKKTPAKHTPPPSNPNLISKQQTRYSTLTPESLHHSRTISIKPKPKKEFNRSQFKKRIKEMKKMNNTEDNVRKMVKCFWAVYFCQCLKKMSMKIVSERKKFFIEFWPNQFKKFIETFKDYFYTSFFPFFKFLKQRQSINFLCDEDDSKTIMYEKKKSFKELLKIFFTCLKPLKDIENLGKVAWGFCSNGSFVQKGVLTASELQILCFNQAHGTLLMDDNLQKSQIITLIFLKIIIFKFILNCDKKWPQDFNPQQNKILTLNLKLIASFLYDIFIQVQQQYLNHVNTKKYPLGNYFSLKQHNNNNKAMNLLLSPPLLYQTDKAEKEEIISGLYEAEFLKQNLRIKKTHAYIEVIKEVVEGLHKFCKDYDAKFKARIRKVPQRPQYKY